MYVSYFYLMICSLGFELEDLLNTSLSVQYAEEPDGESVEKSLARTAYEKLQVLIFWSSFLEDLKWLFLFGWKRAMS